MYLSRVIGNVVSTTKDDGLVGFKLMLIQRIDRNLEYMKDPEIAVDTVGAGIGEVVIVTRGSMARHAASRPNSPVDAAIVGIVDEVQVEDHS